MTRILVTGASGSIGTALWPELEGELLLTDTFEMNVEVEAEVNLVMRDFRPELVYHLAGAKSAPAGELYPENALLVNGVGTWNVLRAARGVGAKVVTASSCKAADAETAYGASKLLAERMTLNSGGWAARLYNVRESSGNVFDLWAKLPPDERLPVTPCTRFFISLEQAVSLLVAIPELPPGRYAVDPGAPWTMVEAAAEHYPGRALNPIERRRGDRTHEPLHACSEWAEPIAGGLLRIHSAHDEAAPLKPRLDGQLRRTGDGIEYDPDDPGDGRDLRGGRLP